MKVGEVRRTKHLFLGYAVNSYVVGVEVVLRIHKANFRIYLFSILEGHNSDLADATHPRIGCFKIDRDKPHTCLLPSTICELLGIFH
jgi:hypothetical protein